MDNGASVTMLTDQEARHLCDCEAVIDRQLQAFYEVGVALLTIRDQRLYRAKHNSFEDYCRDRWQMGRSRSYQLIGAAQVAENLSTIVDSAKPTREFQLRPLVGLEPEEQRSVWTQAVAESSGQTPTAAKVQQVVRGRAPRPRRSSLYSKAELAAQMAAQRIHECLPLLDEEQRKALAPELRSIFVADQPIGEQIRRLRESVMRRRRDLERGYPDKGARPSDSELLKYALLLIRWIEGELKKLDGGIDREAEADEIHLSTMRSGS